MVKIFVFLLFSFISFAPFVASYGVGVTPDKVIFNDKQSDFFIFNSNDATVSYSMIGCEMNKINMERIGTIGSNSRKQIHMVVNDSDPDSLSDCDLDIAISSSLFEIGFSIPVKFSITVKPISTENILEHNSTVKQQDKNSNQKSTKTIWFISLGLGLAITLFIIWKFL